MLYLYKRVNQGRRRLGNQESTMRALKGIPKMIRKISDVHYQTQGAPRERQKTVVAITFKERISVGSPIHIWT